MSIPFIPGCNTLVSKEMKSRFNCFIDRIVTDGYRFSGREWKLINIISTISSRKWYVLGWDLASARYQPRPCGQQRGFASTFFWEIYVKNIFREIIFFNNFFGKNIFSGTLLVVGGNFFYFFKTIFALYFFEIKKYFWWQLGALFSETFLLKIFLVLPYFFFSSVWSPRSFLPRSFLPRSSFWWPRSFLRWPRSPIRFLVAKPRSSLWSPSSSL